MYHYYIQFTWWIITHKSVEIIKKSTPAAPRRRRWVRRQLQQARMLKIACTFTCKSLGVVVVASELKLQVSGEVSNSIVWSKVRTGATTTNRRYDDDDDDDWTRYKWINAQWPLLTLSANDLCSAFAGSRWWLFVLRWWTSRFDRQTA